MAAEKAENAENATAQEESKEEPASTETAKKVEEKGTVEALDINKVVDEVIASKPWEKLIEDKETKASKLLEGACGNFDTYNKGVLSMLNEAFQMNSTELNVL